MAKKGDDYFVHVGQGQGSAALVALNETVLGNDHDAWARVVPGDVITVDGDKWTIK